MPESWWSDYLVVMVEGPNLVKDLWGIRVSWGIWFAFQSIGNGLSLMKNYMR